MSKYDSRVSVRGRLISDEKGRPGMTASTTMLSELAKRLDEAARNATAVDQLAEPIDAAEAYEVQRLSVARRIARGERHMGIKMGLTSRVKMAQMGVSEMIWGRLTDGMRSEGHTSELQSLMRISY